MAAQERLELSESDWLTAESIASAQGLDTFLSGDAANAIGARPVRWVLRATTPWDPKIAFAGRAALLCRKNFS